MTGLEEDLNLKTEENNSLPSALQCISILKRYYSGAVALKLRNGLQDEIFLLKLAAGSSRRVFTNGPTKIRMIWHGFIAPTSGQKHHDRISNFYRGQADVYDETREGLLKGRKTMLRLSAAHLSEIRKSGHQSRPVWIDIGGGTGYNIEAMDAFLPIKAFDAVYLVDIRGSLLQIAEKRFASRGWTNIHVVHQDAASFILPKAPWSDCMADRGSISLITFSYALSMIPDFYAVLDRISSLLAPEGLIGVVDFYTSGHNFQCPASVADVNRACGRISRWFWQIWFDFDNMMVGPQRREYLEHKFETVKILNGRNRFLIPSLIHIPYYVWLGRPRRTVSSTGETLAQINVTQDRLGSLFQNVPWRVPYTAKPSHGQMNTFMYAFTWEDPLEDMKHLVHGPDDSLLVITSAGDNVLHYALQARFQSIHCVDMNPCQGHLLELKIAALKVLPYEVAFSMFGRGHVDSFQEILDLKLSPLLSAPCYQFWKANAHMFMSSMPLYMHGFSGLALRIVRIVFKFTGRLGDVERLCNAKSITEQIYIWTRRVRPVLLNRLTVFFLNNRWICWRALGVPENQRNMLLAEGTAYDYIKDTLDPVVASKHLKGGGYHYFMTLMGHYSPTSCPLYLTRNAFDVLQSSDGDLMNPIKIHTDTITGVLETMPSSSLSRAILMDHLDWFSEDSIDAIEEIQLLYRVLKPGGFILLRSAARSPWYIKRFMSSGFEPFCLNVRKPGSKEALDRVNMYASFWKVKRPGITA
ncbi:hypothetical protein ACEPAF_7410 [Sanghuangporus sanghuang]